MNRCTITFPVDLYSQLQAHLFPGDDDEHGGVIAAAVADTPSGTRLLAREVYLAADGSDYLPGTRSHRTLSPVFVRESLLKCRDAGLVYLAVHNHLGSDRVGFSSVDIASHKRGYPTLVDINRGTPAGALVFARNAMAGEVFLKDGSVQTIEGGVVLGHVRRELHARPRSSRIDPMFDRQSRLFGDAGQALLQSAKVGVIGAGGVGIVLVELLARLGVGHFVVADPDVVEPSNLPRLVGATRADAGLTMKESTAKSAERRHRTSKVALARRLVRRANPLATFQGIKKDFQAATVARQFTDCDYLFLAADSMQARLLFNAMVHQYLIPGVQLGSKVRIDAPTGTILDVYCVVRPVWPGQGCLWCNELISPGRLQSESVSTEERKAQQYVDDPIVIAPSVITMNAVAASRAANDFLFWAVGLAAEGANSDYLTFRPTKGSLRYEMPRRDETCFECGQGGRYAKGDLVRLPARAG